ncbi:unnamed protein product, partial [Durusdinium trenchii]
PGAVDVMPPRHFVSFQPNQVVVKDANEVNYTTDSRASIKEDWFVGPRVTWIYFPDAYEVVVDNFRWQGCNPALRSEGHKWQGFARFCIRKPPLILDLRQWLNARALLEELRRSAQQLMSLHFQDKNNYKVNWNEVFVLQADVTDMVGNFPLIKRLVTPQKMQLRQ